MKDDDYIVRENSSKTTPNEQERIERAISGTDLMTVVAQIAIGGEN